MLWGNDFVRTIEKNNVFPFSKWKKQSTWTDLSHSTLSPGRQGFDVAWVKKSGGQCTEVERQGGIKDWSVFTVSWGELSIKPSERMLHLAVNQKTPERKLCLPRWVGWLVRISVLWGDWKAVGSEANYFILSQFCLRNSHSLRCSVSEATQQ